MNLTADVPKGSIIGPLLFLVYSNDIVNDINFTICLFADDTSLYIIVDSPKEASDKLNQDLEKIAAWADMWLVLFNRNKTEPMIFSRKLINLFIHQLL